MGFADIDPLLPPEVGRKSRAAEKRTHRRAKNVTERSVRSAPTGPPILQASRICPTRAGLPPATVAGSESTCQEIDSQRGLAAARRERRVADRAHERYPELPSAVSLAPDQGGRRRRFVPGRRASPS